MNWTEKAVIALSPLQERAMKSQNVGFDEWEGMKSNGAKGRARVHT
jgi:hypothetical protein